MTLVRTFDGFSPPRRFDSIPFVSVEIQEGSTQDGPFTTIDTLNLIPTDSDPAEPMSRDFTTALAQIDPAWYVLVWIDGSGASFASEPISSLRRGFATVQDVEVRMGHALTDVEQELATFVIEQVTGLIAQAAGQNDAWAAALHPVPAYFKALCVEKAVGALANPNNLAVASETLGAYSVSQTFPPELDTGVFLTDAEERKVRQIANNAVSGSVRVPSLVHDAYVTEES